MSTRTILVYDKVPAVTRSTVTNETTVSFPAGGLSDQKPVINLLLEEYATSERIDTYFDCGVTDTDKNLDIFDPAKVLTLYSDPAYGIGVPADLGVLPPKAIMMRCIQGSGLIYLNINPSLDTGLAPKLNIAAPLSLHAGAGAFYYVFPRRNVHYSAASYITDPTIKYTFPISLLTMHLRTFEVANRFQLLIFK